MQKEIKKVRENCGINNFGGMQNEIDGIKIRERGNDEGERKEVNVNEGNKMEKRNIRKRPQYEGEEESLPIRKMSFKEEKW